MWTWELEGLYGGLPKEGLELRSVGEDAQWDISELLLGYSSWNRVVLTRAQYGAPPS